MISNSIVDGKYGDVIYTLSTAHLERSYPFTIKPIRVEFNELINILLVLLLFI